MTDAREIWSEAKRNLTAAVTSLGFPAELSDLLAKELGSPRAIDRMTSYLYHVRPKAMEIIADEMLAISSMAETWREKKESEEAQAAVSAWYRSEARDRLYREEQDEWEAGNL